MSRKRVHSCLLLVAGLIVTMASAAASAPLTVGRLDVATGVEDREPVGVAESFPASTETVFAFLEARDIPAATTVSFVWFVGDAEVGRIPIPISEGGRWRTWASKTLGGRAGQWRVEVQDDQNTVLGAKTFTVE